MSDTLGPINYGSGSNEVFIGRDMGQVKDYSNETAAKIDKEVHDIVTDAYKKTEDILNAHMDKLHEVAGYLIKYEKMSGETFEQIMNNTYVEEAEETAEENSTEE